MTRNTEERYTKPQICRPADGLWFIYFEYWNEPEQRWQKITRSEKLNYIKDIAEKEKMFQALCEAREIWLQNGWNPIADPKFESRHINKPDEQADLKKMSFVAALDFAYNSKKKDWKGKSASDYKSVVKYLKESAAAIGISFMQITKIERPAYKTLLEHARTARKLTPQGYNKYRDYLSSLLGELCDEYDVIEYNPIEKLKYKPVKKTIAHRPPTTDERVLIVDRIRSADRNYFRFISLIFGCSIRPKEICALKIKNLHRREQIFRLIPEQEESTKTNTERDVAIPDWVMDLLAELNLHTYPADWYIFSTQNKYGSFLPGPNMMHSNTPTNNWHKHVKAPVAEGGLGLNIDQYSLKKLSGDELIRLKRREGTHNLISIAQQQMGHTDAAVTRVYTEEDEVINRELIKRKMPQL